MTDELPIQEVQLTIIEGSTINQGLVIRADGFFDVDTACDHYSVSGFTSEDMQGEARIPFQHGLVSEVGTNGLSDEAMVAILIDRFTAKQSGPLQCDEWRETLIRFQQAQAWMQARTLARISRGVEGTNNP